MIFHSYIKLPGGNCYVHCKSFGKISQPRPAIGHGILAPPSAYVAGGWDYIMPYGKLWLNRPPYLENEIGNPISHGILRARYAFNQFHSVPLVGISKAQLQNTYIELLEADQTTNRYTLWQFNSLLLKMAI